MVVVVHASVVRVPSCKNVGGEGYFDDWDRVYTSEEVHTHVLPLTGRSSNFVMDKRQSYLTASHCSAAAAVAAHTHTRAHTLTHTHVRTLTHAQAHVRAMPLCGQGLARYTRDARLLEYIYM